MFSKLAEFVDYEKPEVPLGVGEPTESKSDLKMEIQIHVFLNCKGVQLRLFIVLKHTDLRHSFFVTKNNSYLKVYV